MSKFRILDYINQTVVAVKRFNEGEILKLYELGYRNFGFNRDSDLLNFNLDNNINKHFIGYLQTNKVKKIINQIDFLHSLSTQRLCQEIQKHRIDPLNCFIQVNLTNESTKNGISINELADFLLNIKKYDKINIVGLMTIGHPDDLELTKEAFKTLNSLKETYDLNYTSMGMSSDWEIAINNKADFIRIGTKLKEVI